MALDETNLHQIALGNLCMQWANLEYQLSICIWRLLNIHPDVGMVLTGLLDIKALCVAARDLAEKVHAPTEFQAQIKEAKSEIDGLLVRRNLHVHGVGKILEGTRYLEAQRGKGRGKLVKIDHRDINSLATEVHALSGRISMAADQAGLMKVRIGLLLQP